MINPINANYSYRNINFTSKDPDIRWADDIARKVNKVYTRVSPSLVLDYPNLDKFPGMRERYKEKYWKFRDEKSEARGDLYEEGTLMDEIRVGPDLVYSHRMGNCGDSAELSALAAKINGIENFTIGCLDSSDTGDLDHEVLVVNEGKKPYIIDSWLGFADYVPKAIERYKSEYGYHFDLSGDDSEVIEVLTYPTKTVLRINMASKEELQEAFPELMLPKTKKESKELGFRDKNKNFSGSGCDAKLDIKA